MIKQRHLRSADIHYGSGRMDSERIESVSLETALAIIRNCMTLMRIGDFNESVRTVVKDIIKISGARSCRIMLVDDEHKRAINYCEELAEGLDPSKMPGSGVIPYEIVKTWEKMIGDKSSVMVSSQRELEEIAERAPGLAMMMKRNNTTSLVMLPLRRGDKIIGFMYVINYNTDKVEDIRDLVELMSFFIATEIFNNQLMEKLERMSVEDALTGLCNRNAMIRRMNSIIKSGSSKSVGIINMDLNGLKFINDTRGHEAGDNYLKHAADVMRGIFAEDSVYRSGGDEFIAIVEGKNHSYFNGLIGSIRDASEADPEFNIAVGAYWSDEGLSDAKTAFRTADRSMYIDKKSYYDNHPEYDRRMH